MLSPPEPKPPMTAGRAPRRLRELYDDPATTGPACANANLPAELMAAILDAPLDPQQPQERKVLVLGRAMPSHEAVTEI